jgi:ABC-2 type transport system ATP-binding protein
MIRFEHVEKSFGSVSAVRDVSWEIPAGQVTGLLGPNGSGKTTCLRLILNLFVPDAGRVEVLGSRPSDVVSDQIGYLPEERGLYRRMTVRDVLRYYARLKSFRASKADIDAWLERLHLLSYADRRVGELSKGTAQKVQFVATVLHAPKLVILDEPFSGLDPVSATLMRQVLSELVADGTTIVLSTHDMHLAENLCGHFLMLHRGVKVLDKSRAALDAEYSEKTLKVTSTEPLGDLATGCEVSRFGNTTELIVPKDADPHALLARICASIKVENCEISRPSLQDIFLRLAQQ